MFCLIISQLHLSSEKNNVNMCWNIILTRIKWYAEDEAFWFYGMLIHCAFVPRRIHSSCMSFSEAPACKSLECQPCLINFAKFSTKSRYICRFPKFLNQRWTNTVSRTHSFSNIYSIFLSLKISSRFLDVPIILLMLMPSQESTPGRDETPGDAESTLALTVIAKRAM